jgi:hypothetical protein
MLPTQRLSPRDNIYIFSNIKPTISLNYFRSKYFLHIVNTVHMYMYKNP